MPTAVLKLFARHGTGWTDGQSGNYKLPPLGSIKITPFMSVYAVLPSLAKII